MQWARDLADRLGVSVWVIWVGLAGIAIAVFILVRRAQAGVNANGLGAGAGSGVLNGPFAGGIDGTTANPNPPSPNGGADTGTTPAPVQTPPTPASPPSPVTNNKIFVHPAAWPAPTSTLSGLAAHYGTTLSNVESFPENQYIKNRSSWNLIYTSDVVRVR